MVQLQLANGVANTKSMVRKLEDKWEAIIVIEPLRRRTTLILAFDLDASWDTYEDGVLLDEDLGVLLDDSWDDL